MQSCKAVSNHLLYTSCPGNPLTHPEGDLPARCMVLISTAESRSQCRGGQISSSHKEGRSLSPGLAHVALNSSRIWLSREIRTVEQRGQ